MEMEKERQGKEMRQERMLFRLAPITMLIVQYDAYIFHILQPHHLMTEN